MEWKDVEPAYGRDYKNRKEVMADWLADKDFKLVGGGPYINRQDAIRYQVAVVVRYSKGMKVVSITPTTTK